ncbi:MAG: hypothetical protein RLZZ385_1619 [Pseudomonadota bacterium]|jgi:UDP-GlcNAc:undecaprenyl-phosphate GlcNAc-1-phosphate transferase
MNYITLASSFFLTAISLLALRPFATRVGLVDIPGGRKTHEVPTPLVGGLGIYLGTLLIAVFTPSVIAHYGAMLALSALVLFIGILDDAFELKVVARMGGHAVAALLMATVAGVQLENLGDLVGLGDVHLGMLSVPLTVFATVGVINAINMADGLDGLSGGLVLIALTCIGFTSLMAGNLTLLSFVVILSCAVIAFLSMNFRLLWKKRAMIYLGDSGSTMLGFILAWLLIDSTQGPAPVFKPVFALWFIAIPLIDTVFLLASRPLRGLSPFNPGIDHLHHNLIKQGLDTKTTVLLMYAGALTFGVIGLIGFVMQVAEGFMFLAFLALFGFYLYVGQVLGRLNHTGRSSRR